MSKIGCYVAAVGSCCVYNGASRSQTNMAMLFNVPASAGRGG